MQLNLVKALANLPSGEQRAGMIDAINGRGKYAHLKGCGAEIQAVARQFLASRPRHESTQSASFAHVDEKRRRLEAGQRAEAAPIAQHMADVYDFCIGKSRINGQQPLHVPPMSAPVAASVVDGRPRPSLSAQVVDLVGRMGKVYRGGTSGGPAA